MGALGGPSVTVTTIGTDVKGRDQLYRHPVGRLPCTLMKLWVDDLRPPPGDDWWWAKTSKRAIAFLYYSGVTEMSLDHDLGGDDTARPVVLHMCEHGVWPRKIRVHSANPVGVEWLEGMIERYRPE